jgi:hypothetical protein
VIIMQTESAKYLLADDGAVLGRSNGPVGWDYSGRWIITGFAKRSHSAHAVPLQAALTGEDFGFGYVRDLDHGTPRQWGERVVSLYRVEPDDEYAQRLVQLWRVPVGA